MKVITNSVPDRHDRGLVEYNELDISKKEIKELLMEDLEFFAHMTYDEKYILSIDCEETNGEVFYEDINFSDFFTPLEFIEATGKKQEILDILDQLNIDTKNIAEMKIYNDFLKDK